MKRAALTLLATATLVLGSGTMANAYPPSLPDEPSTTIDDGGPVAPTTTDNGEPVAPTTTMDDGGPVAPTTTITITEEPGGTLPPTGSGTSYTGTIALGLVVLGGLLTIASIRRRQPT